MTTTSMCRPSCAAEAVSVTLRPRPDQSGPSGRHGYSDTGHMSVRIRRVTTTRAGGVSKPPFDTFNLGDHVGDDPAAVAANRARLAKAIKLSADRVVWMNQVHGDRVTVVDEPTGTVVEATD